MKFTLSALPTAMMTVALMSGPIVTYASTGSDNIESSDDMTPVTVTKIVDADGQINNQTAQTATKIDSVARVYRSPCAVRKKTRHHEQSVTQAPEDTWGYESTPVAPGNGPRRIQSADERLHLLARGVPCGHARHCAPGVVRQHVRGR